MPQRIDPIATKHGGVAIEDDDPVALKHGGIPVEDDLSDGPTLFDKLQTGEVLSQDDADALGAWVHGMVFEALSWRPPVRQAFPETEEIREPANATSAVKVTEPYRYPDVNQKTGAAAPRIPYGQMPLLDAPMGLPKVAHGFEGVAVALGKVAAMNPENRVSNLPPTEVKKGDRLVSDATARSANELLEGLFQTAEPLIAIGGITNFAATATGLVQAYLASKIGAKAAEVVGASEEGQRLAGNLAAALSGVIDTKTAMGRGTTDAQAVITGALRKVQETAQAAVVAGKLRTGFGSTRFGEAVRDVVRPGVHAGAGTGTSGVVQGAGADVFSQDVIAGSRPYEATGPSRIDIINEAAAERIGEVNKLVREGMEAAEGQPARTVQDLVDQQPAVDAPSKAGRPPTGAVYHGTDADFDTFEHSEDIGFHFGSLNTANARLQQGEFKNGRIVEATLDIKNPLALPDLHTWSPRNVLNALVDAGVMTEDEADGIDLVDRETIAPFLERAGYDGIVYPNETEGGGDSYIAIRPEQITITGKQMAEAPAADPIATAHGGVPVVEEQPRKYSSTQVQLPESTAKKLTALAATVADEDLTEDGRETDPHITVKYGIHDEDVAELRYQLESEPPIRVTLGKTSVFPDSGNGDVVKVDVDSPDLHRLNAKIAKAVETTDTHPDYQPHATVAYVKPGMGQKYAGLTDLEGATETIDQIVFSTPSGEKVVIDLKGETKQSDEDEARYKSLWGSKGFEVIEAISVDTAKEFLRRARNARTAKQILDSPIGEALQRKAGVDVPVKEAPKPTPVPDDKPSKPREGRRKDLAGIISTLESTIAEKVKQKIDVSKDKRSLELWRAELKRLDEAAGQGEPATPAEQPAKDEKRDTLVQIIDLLEKNIAAKKAKKLDTSENERALEKRRAELKRHDEATAPAAKPEPKKPEKTPAPAKAERTYATIGKNRNGHELREDDRGHRSYLEGDFWIGEAVRVRPSRAGVETDVPETHGADYVPVEPKAETPDAAEGVESTKEEAPNAPTVGSDIGELPKPEGVAADPVRGGGEGALEAVPAGKGEATGSKRDTGPRDSQGVPADGVRDGVGALSKPEAVEATSPERIADAVPVSPSGATHDPGQRPPDWQLTPERIERIIKRGDFTRAADNLAAIELVLALIKEDRWATPEEQEVLAKYVGWGGTELAKFTQDRPHYNWSANEKAIWERLKAVTTPEQFRGMASSINNAHYTFGLYGPIWAALEHAGFTGGKVLEPSVGVGHAFGFMPADVRVNSTLQAVEIDPLTAAIAKYLYPSARVQATGYENARIARGTQDLIISNVPFGDWKVVDKLFPAFLTHRIHNYFFAKAMEHVRPGGLVVFLTSRYTLDNVAFSDVRRYLSEKAQFVGAVRLPNVAFDKSAKTEVVTDLIVLRRLREGEEPTNVEAFVKADEHPTLRKDAGWGRRGKRNSSPVYRSRWYTEHPELIVGEESMSGSMYAGGEYTVTGKREDLDADLTAALKKILTPGTYQTASKAAPPDKRVVQEGERFKPGELRVGAKGTIEKVARDGTIDDATPKNADGTINTKAVARIAGMIGIRDVRREVIRVMQDVDSTPAAVKAAQKKLNQVYDAFIAKWKNEKGPGYLNSPVNKALFKHDPEATNLLGLEKLKTEAKVTIDKNGKPLLRLRQEVIGKQDIFTRRTLGASPVVTKVETAEDALWASMAAGSTLDWPYMAKIYGKSVKAIQRELLDAGRIFEQPDGSHVLADEYLSGDVVTKLEDAKATEDKKYASNIKALEAVQPAAKTEQDVETGMVDVSIGGHWIPAEHVQTFIAEQIDVPANQVTARLEGSEALVQWRVQYTDVAARMARSHPLSVHYNPSGDRMQDTYSFLDLVNDTLNLKNPDLGHWEGSARDGTRRFVREPQATLAARANQDMLRQRWLSFVHKNPAVLSEMLDIFNKRFNRTVERQYDGSYLTFAGMATLINSQGEEVKFFPHQTRGVARGLVSGNLLLAHEVGAGKTFLMIALAMEMRRTGRAQKPMIVVPTYLLAQWREAVTTLYPAAKVLAFDNKDLDSKKRQTAMARIAHGDWDIVLVPHSSFGLLKPSEASTMAVLERWRQEMEDAMDADVAAGDDSQAAKARERMLKKIKDKIQAKRDKLEKSTDNALTWDELGVDALMIDEAQAFKNLFFFTKIENLRGLSRSEADRSLDLYTKIEDINKNSNYRNLVLATATPIMNSLSEAYTMQRYLQPQTLRQHGIESFDNWYAMFAQASAKTEQQPDGSYKEVTRLREFRNLQTLSKMIRQVMDYVGWEDMPYLKLPKYKGGRIRILQTPEHPMYPKVKEWFADRMARLRETPPHYDFRKKVYIAPARPHPITGHDTGKQDNILTIMNDAKKAAVDVRMVLGEYAADFAKSRIQTAANEMARIYKSEHKRKGVQLVFMDMGTPPKPTPLEFLTGVTVVDETEGELEETEDLGEESEDVAPEVDDQGLINLYDELKRQLIKRGIPSKEIAFIHQARNSAERLALFDAANKGIIRFLFASTDKGGVGMNIQERLAAMHELDPPSKQRPGDLRQRLGRIMRQGNMYADLGGIEVIRYVTQGSTDEWLWGLMNVKDYQTRQFLKGNASKMQEDDYSMDEAQMLASGDPRGIELIGLKSKMPRLEAQAMAAERSQAKAKADVERGQQEKKHAEDDLKEIDAFIKAHGESMAGDRFTMTIGGHTYTDRGAAKGAFHDAVRPIIAAGIKAREDGTRDFSTWTTVGTIGGATIKAQYSGFFVPASETKKEKFAERHAETVILTVHFDKNHSAMVNQLAVANPKDLATLGEGQNIIASLSSAFGEIANKRAYTKESIGRATDKIAAAERTLAEPTTAISDYTTANARMQAIEKELLEETVAAEAARAAAKAATAAPAATPAKDDDDDGDDDGGPAAMAQGSQRLPRRPAPAKQTTALPVDAIVNKLSLLFDKVPVNVGHFRQRARAIYKPKIAAVRARVANDLYAVAHEFGHHIDMALMKGSAVHKRGKIAAELKKIGAPTSLPSYSAKQQRQEGAAEFFGIWMLEPERLPTEAPLYLAEFERYLAANPEIAEGLEDIRQDVQTYLSLPGHKQAELHIDFEGGSYTIMARAERLAAMTQDSDAWKNALASLSAAWVDDLAWVNRVEKAITDGQSIDITQSAYALMRLARGAVAKAEGFLRFGVRNRQGQLLGGSFDQAMKPIVGRMRQFATYITNVHAREMMDAGYESGLSEGQIEDTIDTYQSPEFDKAFDGVKDFNASMRRYMVDGGVLTPAGARAMARKWADYVPMQRVMEEASNIFSGASSRRSANRSSPVKRLGGKSTRRIVNPLESIIKNTHAAVSAVEANKAMLALVNLITKNESTAKWMEEIQAPQVATRFNLSQIQDQLRQELERQGIEVPDNFELDDLATVFTPRQFANGDKRMVTVIDNGTLRWFEVHEPGLYDAITAVGPQNAGAVVGWFRLGAQNLRRLATATVGFVFTNPIRDIPTAIVQSRAGFTPIDFLRGLFSYLAKDEDFQLFMHSGAGAANLVSADRDLLRKRLDDLKVSRSRQLLNHTVLGPLDGLRAVSEAFENATRVGEFKKTLKKEGRDEAGIMQGGLNARDVTQDFSVMGANVRAWNGYVAFFGATVGGVPRLVQAIQEGGGGGAGGATGGFGRPKDHKAPGALGVPKLLGGGGAGFMWKGLTSITLVSVLLWILHKDDEEYQQLPAWEKNAYFHVPLGGGKYARFKKPFIVGLIFGTSVEVALDWLFDKDPSVMKRLPDSDTAKQMLQMAVPTVILPLVEVSMNYSLFRGREILNPFDTEIELDLQYNRWTSETAKKVGPLIGIAPAYFDYLVYGYTAGVGRGVLEGVDMAVGATKPSGGLERLPGVGSFYRGPATSDAQSIADLYDAREQLDGLKASIKRYEDSGRKDKAAGLIKEHGELLARDGAIHVAAKAMSGYKGQINHIFTDGSLTPGQKRQQLDHVYLQMRAIAKAALNQH